MNQFWDYFVLFGPPAVAWFIFAFTLMQMHIYSDFNRWQPGREWFQEYRQDRQPRYWYSDDLYD